MSGPPDPSWTLSQVRDSDCALSPLFALLAGVPADSPRIVPLGGERR